MNNSLARLYQSHSQSLVTAAVTPVQKSDNELATDPPVTDSEHEKVMLTPQSPHFDNNEHNEPPVDGNQKIKATAQFVVCNLNYVTIHQEIIILTVYCTEGMRMCVVHTRCTT